MSKGKCPQAGATGCWVAERRGGCFSDIDHIVPQRYRYMGWLVSKYIDTPENKERVCRWLHEQKTNSEAESIDQIPSEQFMLDAVQRAVDNRTLKTNRRDRRRLEAYHERLEVDRGVELLPLPYTTETVANSMA